MAADWTKLGIAGVYGAVDKALQDQDVKAGRSEAFETWSDYGRIAGAVGGVAIQMFMPRYSRIAEAVALPATAMLVQSVWRYAAGMSTDAHVNYVPVRKSTPAKQPAAQRYPAPAYQNEFKNIRLS